ncbi:hypothetical protein LN42_01935 [Marinitoga sp. 1137]|uniref:hypothetical protein n=1 Tax=Marinitoga sp. 1137 TaxID=1545835 RepID=UPI0009506FC0|nr:hypothetical protein [Marinitoga sp. 1137]APT75286.1 hypothetical protein LN42_01935 [Marinitoga sp. 1137]
MVTIDNIKKIIPDEILDQLAADDVNTTDEVLQELIDNATNFINAIFADFDESFKDEMIRNYIKKELYLNAGKIEEAQMIQESFNVATLQREKQKTSSSGKVAYSSASQVFTDDELEKW